MNKTSKNIVAFCVGLLICVALGALIGHQFYQIKLKNEEIASLKEELSKTQTNRFMDLLRFGQWKLQVDELAENNGWELPVLEDSLTTLTVDMGAVSLQGSIAVSDSAGSAK